MYIDPIEFFYPKYRCVHNCEVRDDLFFLFVITFSTSGILSSLPSPMSGVPQPLANAMKWVPGKVNTQMMLTKDDMITSPFYWSGDADLQVNKDEVVFRVHEHPGDPTKNIWYSHNMNWIFQKDLAGKWSESPDLQPGNDCLFQWNELVSSLIQNHLARYAEAGTLAGGHAKWQPAIFTALLHHDFLAKVYSPCGSWYIPDMKKAIHDANTDFQKREPKLFPKEMKLEPSSHIKTVIQGLPNLNTPAWDNRYFLYWKEGGQTRIGYFHNGKCMSAPHVTFVDTSAIHISYFPWLTCVASSSLRYDKVLPDRPQLITFAQQVGDAANLQAINKSLLFIENWCHLYHQLIKNHGLNPTAQLITGPGMSSGPAAVPDPTQDKETVALAMLHVSRFEIWTAIMKDQNADLKKEGPLVQISELASGYNVKGLEQLTNGIAPDPPGKDYSASMMDIAQKAGAFANTYLKYLGYELRMDGKTLEIRKLEDAGAAGAAKPKNFDQSKKEVKALGEIKVPDVGDFKTMSSVVLSGLRLKEGEDVAGGIPPGDDFSDRHAKAYDDFSDRRAKALMTPTEEEMSLWVERQKSNADFLKSLKFSVRHEDTVALTGPDPSPQVYVHFSLGTGQFLAAPALHPVNKPHLFDASNLKVRPQPVDAAAELDYALKGALLFLRAESTTSESLTMLDQVIQEHAAEPLHALILKRWKRDLHEREFVDAVELVYLWLRAQMLRGGSM